MCFAVRRGASDSRPKSKRAQPGRLGYMCACVGFVRDTKSLIPRLSSLSGCSR